MTDQHGRPPMPIPVPDPGTPPPPPKPDPKPDPKPKPPPARITADTPFRAIDTLKPERVCEIVKGYPLEGECGSLGVSALALAQSYKESQYGKTATGKNPLGLMMPDGHTLMSFSSWRNAFVEWQRRMDDPAYKGGVYMPVNMSLKQFIYTYVGGPGCWSSGGATCANGETRESVDLYLAQTIARLNRYLGFTDPEPNPSPNPPSGAESLYSVAGLTTKIMLPFPLMVKLIPTSQTNQRPGLQMNADRYIQHETGNPTPGMGAEKHMEYLFNGAPDNNGRSQQLSYQFTVDDEVAYQMIPVNEVAWHGGDGAGLCNSKGVACELCINHPVGSPQDRQAQTNAAILAAEVMNGMGLGIFDPHVACIGTDHHCPDRILNQPGSFNGYRDRVMRLRQERG